MVLRKLMGLFVCTLILGVASFASAGLPDPGNTEAAMPNYSGVDALSLFNLPNGAGSAFTAAQLPTGGTANATIQITVRDINDAIIVGYPREDMWLESFDGGMVACVAGTNADGETDAAGQAQWATALHAGGWSASNCVVYVNGDALTGVGGQFALHFNSADINADGVVNLNDVGIFAAAFNGAYTYKADFYADGQYNLLDVGRLAAAIGAACP
jgi:hypothetical protein